MKLSEQFLELARIALAIETTRGQDRERQVKCLYRKMNSLVLPSWAEHVAMIQENLFWDVIEQLGVENAKKEAQDTLCLLDEDIDETSAELKLENVKTQIQNKIEMASSMLLKFESKALERVMELYDEAEKIQ